VTGKTTRTETVAMGGRKFEGAEGKPDYQQARNQAVPALHISASISAMDHLAGRYFWLITTRWIVGGRSCNSLCAKPALRNIVSSSVNV
jgi:hypothetical protein